MQLLRSFLLSPALQRPLKGAAACAGGAAQACSRACAVGPAGGGSRSKCPAWLCTARFPGCLG